MQQECIWPRAILCISAADNSELVSEARIVSVLQQKLAPDSFPNIALEIIRFKHEYYLDITHAQIRTGSPEMIARQLQKKLGPNSRLGLSINKPLAQYAASLSVSGSPHVITPWRVNAELGHVHLSKLVFIQDHLQQRLSLHGIAKVHQFITLNRLKITKLFGHQGLKLLDIFRGQDCFAGTQVENRYSKQLTQQLVLPPNTQGRRLILRYLKQLSCRLANVARLQNKFSKKIQLNVFCKKRKKKKILLSSDSPMDGKSLFKELASQIPEKIFTNVVLAIELNFLELENISGQVELFQEPVS